MLYCAVLIISLVTLAAFTGNQSSITGKIKPVDGADLVWLISGKDSVKHSIVTGNIAINVNPGIYKLIIDAKEPYQDVFMENVEVKPGMTLELGEIFLKT